MDDDVIEPRSRPDGEHCPTHPYAKLTQLGCVMCGGAKNAERDRKLGKDGKPKFVLNVPGRPYGM